MSKFYAVRKGRQTGIFTSWPDCQRQVHGVSSEFKSFKTLPEAQRFLGDSTQQQLQQQLQQPQPRAAAALYAPVRSLPRPRSPDPGTPTRLKQHTAWSAFPQEEYPAAQTASLPAKRPGSTATAAPPGHMGARAGASSSSAPASPDAWQASPSKQQRLSTHTGAQERQDGECSERVIGASEDVRECSGDVFTVEFDGACKGNPGVAGAGAVLKDGAGASVCYVMQRIERGTNNEAEYSALILGLEEAQRRGVRRVRVRGDSMLVIRQLRGEWAARAPNLTELHRRATALVRGFEAVDLQHIFRESNGLADKLSNDAIAFADTDVHRCTPYHSDDAYS